MSLIKSNSRNRVFPWNNTGLKSFLTTEGFFKDDFFGNDGPTPAMNVKEKDNEFEIEFAIPGFTKKDFVITLENNVLNVSCEKRQEEVKKAGSYARHEFNIESFSRFLQLPNTVNADKDIKATYKRGILKLNLIKKEEAKQTPIRGIEIA